MVTRRDTDVRRIFLQINVLVNVKVAGTMIKRILILLGIALFLTIDYMTLTHALQGPYKITQQRTRSVAVSHQLRSA